MKTSAAQKRLLHMLPLVLPAKKVGRGYLLPSGMTMKTIGAMRDAGLIKTTVHEDRQFGDDYMWIVAAK